MENKNLVIGAIALVLIAVVFAFFVFSGPVEPGKYDEFGQCLTDSGAEFYGAFWCQHCEQQREDFGSSIENVNYIECSNQDGSQTQECIAKGIRAYPTWQFSDGSRLEGVQTFETLAQKTGCQLP